MMEVKSHQLSVLRRVSSEDLVQSVVTKANHMELCTRQWLRVDPGHFHHAHKMVNRARRWMFKLLVP